MSQRKAIAALATSQAQRIASGASSPGRNFPVEPARREHSPSRLDVRPTLGGGDRGQRPPRQRRRHGVAQPARRWLRGPALGGEPQARQPGRRGGVRRHRQPARGPRAGADLHAAGHRAGPDRPARGSRHARRGRAQRRPRRAAEAGHARQRPQAPAAHRRPQLPGPAVAACPAQRQLRAYRRRAGHAGLRLAVGRAGDRGAGLGQGPRHRLLAFRLAGRACRRRFRRPARLAGQRPAYAFDPALHRVGRIDAQVHVGGAGRGAQQAGARDQGRAVAARPGRSHLAHRRARGVGPGLRRRDSPRRHAARGHAHRPVRRRRDAGALSWPAVGSRCRVARAPDPGHQRRRCRRAGRRCDGRGRGRTRAAGRCHAREARCDAARQLEPRQPGRHHRRRTRGALRADPAGAAGRPQQRHAALHARTDRHRAQRRDRRGAGAGGAGCCRSVAGLLARRRRGAGGAAHLPRGRHPLLRHARRSGARVLDARHLPPQPAAAAAGTAGAAPAGDARPGARACARRCGAGRGARDAQRARSQGLARGQRHPGGRHARGRAGCRRRRVRGAGHWLPGRAEGAFAADLAQERRRRCRAGPERRRRAAGGRRRHAAARGQPTPGRHAGRIHGPGDGAPAAGPGADRRRQRRPHCSAPSSCSGRAAPRSSCWPTARSRCRR